MMFSISTAVNNNLLSTIDEHILKLSKSAGFGVYKVSILIS